MAKYVKTEDGYKEPTELVDSRFDSKMDNVNPIGNGSFSLNRKSGTTIGGYSFAEGIGTTASGNYSHAEGSSTAASGSSSHAEGHQTTASGTYSHAEGAYTTASGNSSHAEGFVTTASGSTSHAEGASTKASSKNQHVQGIFNIEDSADTYADIIGNGTSSSKRSNAATVDWSGNAWYAGDVYVGSTSGTNKDSGSKKLATEEYVNSAVSEIPSGGTVDIPTELPNPFALTFTGAVTASYDGSAAVTVEIPAGGGSSGGSGKAKSQILIDQEITELTASLSVTLEHDFHNLTAIISCGSAGAALTAGSDGTAVASKIGLIIDSTSFNYNSRKVAYVDTPTTTWQTRMIGAEWSDDLSVFKRGFKVDVATGASSKYYDFPFGGTSAMYGTLGTDDNAPRTGKTANIVVNGAYLNVGTRVVLWGEYYE